LHLALVIIYGYDSNNGNISGKLLEWSTSAWFMIIYFMSFKSQTYFIFLTKVLLNGYLTVSTNT